VTVLHLFPALSKGEGVVAAHRSDLSESCGRGKLKNIFGFFYFTTVYCIFAAGNLLKERKIMGTATFKKK
jgi:hypothetical protein